MIDTAKPRLFYLPIGLIETRLFAVYYQAHAPLLERLYMAEIGELSPNPRT